MRSMLSMTRYRRLSVGESSGRSWTGFTLIEVLVVVAIIALLVAILLPSLSKARRNAKVVMCAGNISQLSRGMTSYVHESKGRYPPHLANYPNQVQFQRNMSPFPDYRRILYERLASKQAGVLWCPLVSSLYYMHPSNSQKNLGDPEDDNKWSKIFFVAFTTPGGQGYGGQPSYMSAYAIYAGLTTNPNAKPGEPKSYSQSFSFNYSGNRYTNREPQEAGHPRDAIFSDVNESWPKSGYGLPLRPHRTFHAESPDPAPGQSDDVLRFVNTNVGFGDGSVQTRKRVKNYIGRDGVGSQATGCYSY